MSHLEQQMRNRDREMVPRALVVGMFTMMAAALALVTYEQLSGRANVGVLVEAPVEASRTVELRHEGRGIYTVSENGTVLASSADELGGFYGVMGRVIDRRRIAHGVIGTPPIEIVRRQNGHVAILDPATDFSVELIGYGADNIHAFARLVD
ncbi:photosynthetic complex assembly protein PuhC [Histidinibacterium aquaticum]|uniref:Photosynthetic complex assembly protein n=1 Tax=Histidinibacterium aquaticum TaxID=2613962 RepID=A0A5J5GF71_9RHOB|nr:photosynthetic complex assembly protein PuhC [Histidinibacterium aquaticum]KAA9006879.1 photosynthetic complex assembly protein [Histidinibacterium aquaticum]